MIKAIGPYIFLIYCVCANGHFALWVIILYYELLILLNLAFYWINSRLYLFDFDLGLYNFYFYKVRLILGL